MANYATPMHPAPRQPLKLQRNTYLNMEHTAGYFIFDTGTRRWMKNKCFSAPPLLCALRVYLAMAEIARAAGAAVVILFPAVVPVVRGSVVQQVGDGLAQALALGLGERFVLEGGHVKDILGALAESGDLGVLQTYLAVDEGLGDM